MAFEPKKSELTRVLKESLGEESKSFSQHETSIGDFERTKQYQFTLQPSVRKKIDNLSKEKGYRSASSFINDFFKNL
ncbi:hypothetical protein [Streptococcus uberis]|uniref:hypothetical protein n=1 Tax=Streptococcus uberis TaxID=1349 RepID=UPI001939336A|nr:hypothetical protein [Streptococcus uberis]